MKKFPVGIDLGTSYCSIGWVNVANKVEVLRDSEGDPLMPSAVYFAPNGAVRVGKEALEAGKEDPERLLVETKRLMGNLSRRWRFGNLECSPVDVAVALMHRLRIDFESQVGLIERAVVCVPANYDVGRREHTLEAARRAGLPNVTLLDEPVAAALTQILSGEDLSYFVLAGEQYILVYDLGGGTFDLSLVHYNEKRKTIKVVHTDGELNLGGIDWNRRLEDYVADRAQIEYGIRLRTSPKVWRYLEEWVEGTKRIFSEPAGRTATFGLRVNDRPEHLIVEREAFEDATKDLADKTLEMTLSLIRRSNLGPKINQLLAVGGCTRMPMIRRVLEGVCYFTPQSQRPNCTSSPELAVVEGAALRARLCKPRCGSALPVAAPPPSFAPPQLIPASARSLGVALIRTGQGFINRILIPRNSPLPASATITAHPVRAAMRSHFVIVVEGEGEDLGKCSILGECVLKNLPERLPADSAFSITLSLDESNLLTVLLSHPGSGRQAELTLRPPSAPLVELVSLQATLRSGEGKNGDVGKPAGDPWRSSPHARRYEGLLRKAGEFRGVPGPQATELSDASRTLKRALEGNDAKEIHDAGELLADLVFEVEENRPA